LLKNAVPTIFPGGAEHLMPEVVETLDQPAESKFSINAIFIKKKQIFYNTTIRIMTKTTNFSQIIDYFNFQTVK